MRLNEWGNCLFDCINVVFLFEKDVRVFYFFYRIFYWNHSRTGVKYMPMCGVCGKEVDEQPKITEDGECSICGTELKPA